MAKRTSRKSTDDGAGKAPRRLARSRQARAAIHCIYLYYVKLNEDGDLEEMTAHYYLNGHAPIAYPPGPAIDKLIREIYPEPKLHYTCYGDDPMDMRRRRISYFVVVVDDARGRKLKAPYGLEFKDAIVNDHSNYDGKGEHTFEEFSYREVDVPVEGATKKVQVGTCINLLKSKAHKGDKLHEREMEHFELRLNFGRRGAEGSRADRQTLGDGDGAFNFDSGGTNMGPPVPPPARRR